LWLIGFVAFCFLALGGALFLALVQLTRLETQRAQANEFMLTLLTIDEAMRALSDLEAGNRGFLLTGDEEFREPFRRGRDIFSTRYKQLLEDTADEPVQQERLKSVKVKLTQWFQLYRPLIQKRQREAENSFSLPSSALSSPRSPTLGLSTPIVNASKAPYRSASPPEVISPHVTYQDQAVLLMCSGLFDEIRLLLDEIRTFEEKQYYGIQ
jgi:hypothetical protein